MDLSERVQTQFGESAQLCLAAAEAQSAAIARAARSIVACLINGGRVLCCGNGCSAADSQQFAVQMRHRFDRARPGLPAVTLNSDSAILTAIACDEGFEQIFARQVDSLAHPGDLLLTFSVDGMDESVVAAVDAAHERQLPVIALTGMDGGEIAQRLSQSDVEIRAPAASRARILENHRLVVHCLCDLVDLQLMGG